MKITINALSVDGGGGQTYLENLLLELNNQPGENQYFILLRKNHSVILPPLSKQFRVVLFSIPRPYLIWRFLIEQLVLPFWLKQNKMDLLYSPADATTLLAPCPVVLAMRNPNLYANQDLGWHFRNKLKFAAFSRLAKLSTRKANQIIFVSNASRNMVTDKMNVPEEKINVIYHGVTELFFRKETPEKKSSFLLQDKAPYLLSVSSIYRYKNYVRLIQAFHRIHSQLDKPYRLIIIGSSFDNPYAAEMFRLIRRLDLQDRVHWTGGFPLQELPPIYQNASLFVFPSFLETFGHTLVEAMAAEIPIAAADIPSTREITGGAALYFNPYQVEEMAKTLVEALMNGSLRQSLISRGKDQVKHFSWKSCAEETLQVFSKASERSAPNKFFT